MKDDVRIDAMDRYETSRHPVETVDQHNLIQEEQYIEDGFFDMQEINLKYSFKLEDKSMASLFEYRNKLYYTFKNKHGDTEFIFNMESSAEVDDISFIYIKSDTDYRELHFNTADANYTIYQLGDRHGVSGVGIGVDSNGKHYQLTGIPNTVQGNLIDLFDKETNYIGQNKYKNLLAFKVTGKTSSNYLNGIYQDIKNMTPEGFVRIDNYYDQVVQIKEQGIYFDRRDVFEFLVRYKSAILTNNADAFFSFYLRDSILYKFYSILGESKSQKYVEEMLLQGYTYDIPEKQCKSLRNPSYPKKEREYLGCWTSTRINAISGMQIKDLTEKTDGYEANVLYETDKGTVIHSTLTIYAVHKQDGQITFVIGHRPG